MRSPPVAREYPTVGEELQRDDRRPRIVVVDDDPADLALLENEIGSRYTRDYIVVARSSPVAAMTLLHQLRASGHQVAAVLACQWMDEMEGSQLLAGGRVLHPRAKTSAARRAAGLGASRDRRCHPGRRRDRGC
jgi:hypothetical protein